MHGVYYFEDRDSRPHGSPHMYRVPPCVLSSHVAFQTSPNCPVPICVMSVMHTRLISLGLPHIKLCEITVQKASDLRVRRACLYIVWVKYIDLVSPARGHDVKRWELCCTSSSVWPIFLSFCKLHGGTHLVTETETTLIKQGIRVPTQTIGVHEHSAGQRY